MLPPLNKPYEDSSFAETPATLNGSGCGSRTHYLSGYEPGMIFRFTHPQIVLKNCKIGVGCISIEYLVHPTNKVYHVLTPQPRSFLRDLPTLGAFWLFTLHQTVSFKQRTNKNGSVKGNRTPLTGVKVQCPSR